MQQDILGDTCRFINEHFWLFDTKLCVEQTFCATPLPSRSTQAGRIPSRSQSGGQIKAGGGPRISQAEQTRSESKHAFAFCRGRLLRENIFYRPLYPFFLLLTQSSFLSLPSSLCPSILQSYKKAIDEVSYTRAPTPARPLSYLFIYFFGFIPVFFFASTFFRAPPCCPSA